MSLDTQTTQEISDNIVANLELSFNQTIPLLPKAFNRVLAKVLGGIFVLLYKYGGFIFLQIFVKSASAKETTIFGVSITPIIFWGRLIGVGDPGAGTNAKLTINITVENQVGVLPSGSQLINADNGVTYLTIGGVNLDAAIVSATIEAVSDQVGGNGVGEIGNLDIGAKVSFANPLPNVARDTEVTAQVVTGADPEDIEVFFDQKVVIYSSITDQFGSPISEDSPIRMFINSTITRDDQSDDVFSSTQPVNFDDRDAYEFFVDRTDDSLGDMLSGYAKILDRDIWSDMDDPYDVKCKDSYVSTGITLTEADILNINIPKTDWKSLDAFTPFSIS